MGVQGKNRNKLRACQYSEVPTDDTAAVRFLIFFLVADDGSLNFILSLGIVAFCFIFDISNSERRSIQMIPGSQTGQYRIHTNYNSLRTLN